MRSDDTLSKTLSKLIFFFSKIYVYIYLGNTIHIGRETYKIPSIPDYKMNVCTLIMAENMAAMADNPRSQASKATGQCLQRYLAATMKAIDLALDFINDCNSCNKFVIFSDSLSVLLALNHTISKNQQIQNILLKHHSISEKKTIVYCWVPSRVGIYGNEQVDKKAKESLSLEQTDFKIPFVNFKPFINEYVFNE